MGGDAGSEVGSPHRSHACASRSGVRHLPLTATSLCLVLLCASIWGGQAVAAKVAVDVYPATLVLAWRLLLSLPVLWLASYWSRWSLRLSVRQSGLVLVNTAMVLLQIGLFLVGTEATSSARSIVIINTFPLFAALAGAKLTSDARLTKRQWTGLLVAMAGLQFVLLPRAIAASMTGENTGTLWGDGLVLLAAILVGVKIAYLRRILAELNPLQSVFWSSLFGGVACLAASLLRSDLSALQFVPTAIAGIVYQGTVVSGIAVLTWTYLLSQHPLNKLTVFRLATPPIGLFASWLLLGEPLSASLIAGTLLIITGIHQVNRHNRDSA
ncbi:DMT family transporter [Roseimaritima sediminicola]|uniref:DMT family transporter n=1 Tax=Roseimaritima sediminicola TaxID=2662066 RepID=UPI0012983188|nr:DMT family transporter [Roseimaritima sediminicola]